MFIFVYGSLRYGFELHHYLRKARFVGLGYAENYDMYDLGGYPGVAKGDGRIGRGLRDRSEDFSPS